MDFKEVFKWIMSPKLAQRLNAPPNLDGLFLVGVNFANRDPKAIHNSTSEIAIMNQLMEDLDALGITGMGAGGQSKSGYMFNKRKQKQANKE